MNHPPVKFPLATVLGCVALLVSACAPTELPPEALAEESVSANVSPPLDLQAIIRRVNQAFRAGEGDFTGGQETYAVRVDEDGTVRFSPRHWPDEARGEARTARMGEPLRVRTTSVSRGGQPLSAEVARGAVREDGALALRRGPVVEVLHNGEEGLEQRWELASKPSGSGALEVRVELSGLEYVGPTEQGHHFVDRRSGLGVRYGKATWVDARGVRTAVEPVREGDALVMRVPEAVLEDSAWPAVLDPVISPEISPGNPVPAPTTSGLYRPRIASAGGLYLVVWDVYSGGYFVQGTRVNASTGEVLDPNGITLASGTTAPQTPSVASNGSDFLVVWQTYVSSAQGYDIYGSRVKGSTGKAIDTTPIRISTVASSDQSDPMVAYAGNLYFVAWKDARSGAPGLYGARVTTSGTVYDSSGILLAPGTVYWPTLATDGSTVLLAWAVADSVTAHDIQGVRVQASSGTKLGSILELSKGPGARSSPAVSFAGGHFLVVWEDRRVDASVSELYGTRIRASDGAVLDASGIPIATAPANRPYGSNFAVGSDGNRFLVLWEQLTAPASTTRALQGVRVGTDGVVSDTASQPLSDVSTTGGLSPAVAFDGTNFLVLRRDVRNNRNSFYATRVRASDLALLDTPPFLVTTQLNQVKAPAVAQGGDVYLVVWNDSRDREGTFDIYGVRVRASDGVLLDPLGIPIGQGVGAQTSPAVASDGSRFLVVWDDARNSTTSGLDIRGAWVRGSDGGVSDPQGFVVAAAPRDQARPRVAFGEGTYFVAWEDSRNALTSGNSVDVHGARIRASDGVILDPDGLVVSSAVRSQWHVDVAFGGGVFLVIWEDTRNVYFISNIHGARVRASDGGVLDSGSTPFISTPSVAQQAPRVAFDGTNFLTVWKTKRFSGEPDLRGTRVRASDGGVLDAAGLVLFSGTSSFQDFPGLGFDGEHYLLAYWESVGAVNRLEGIRFKTDGTRVDTTAILIDTMTASYVNAAPPAIASWGKGRFLVAYESYDTVSSQFRGRMRLVSDPVNGAKCASNAACTSGYCVDGVCCNSACAGGTCGSGTCFIPLRVSCPAAIQAEAADASGATVSYPPATATGGTSPLTLGYSHASGSRFALGSTSVTATVTDGAGGTASCSFDVSVSDTTAPTLSCPAHFRAEATDATGATVSYPPATVTDAVSSSVTLDSSPVSGSHFDLGTTPVSVQATDEAGNSSRCGFSVTVSDTTAPTLACPANLKVEATSTSGATVSYPLASATDAVSSSLTFAYSKASGSHFDLGTTLVTIQATDEAGNAAACGFSVTVRLPSAPQVTCPEALEAEATDALGALVSYPPATATGTEPLTLSYSQDSGTRFVLGTTPVTVTVTDGLGLSASCDFGVTVHDSVAPEVGCPGPFVVEAQGPSGAPVVFSLPPPRDAVSAPSVSSTHAPGSLFPLGTTSVTVSATDEAGNAASCSFDVTVRDTTAPTLVCPADVSVTTASDEGGVVEYPAPTAEDAVSMPGVGLSAPSGGHFPLGDTQVTATATDAAGNSATCTFRVRVTRDSPGPLPEPLPDPRAEPLPAGGCGCGAAASDGLGGAALLLLSWVAARRRRDSLAG